LAFGLGIVLFFALLVTTFFLARRLFDKPTAWLSAALLFGADIMWRFTVSGISTTLVLLIFVGVVWCLVLIEETVREGNRGLISLAVLVIVPMFNFAGHRFVTFARPG